MAKEKTCETCLHDPRLCNMASPFDDPCSGWARHDGCGTCFWYECADDEYPCSECIGCIPNSDPRYAAAHDLYCNAGCPPIDDVVNHPSHYTHGSIECIDAMESAFGAEELAIYCKIVAFKYLWRMEHKNGLEDIEKAIWYLNKLVELKKKGKNRK